MLRKIAAYESSPGRVPRTLAVLLECGHVHETLTTAELADATNNDRRDDYLRNCKKCDRGAASERNPEVMRALKDMNDKIEGR